GHVLATWRVTGGTFTVLSPQIHYFPASSSPPHLPWRTKRGIVPADGDRVFRWDTPHRRTYRSQRGPPVHHRIHHRAFTDRLMSAADAARLVQPGMTVAMSGFTGAGYPKAVPGALAEHMQQAHDA